MQLYFPGLSAKIIVMVKPLLQIKNLSKSFHKSVVLADINLDIFNGEIFGLLGPNGAGKTTLIKSILKLLRLDSGDIIYNNHNLLTQDIYQDFGYLPENFSPPRELTAREFMEALSFGFKLSNDRAVRLIKEVELDENKRISQYSKGMIQRLGLAQAFLKQPKFVIIDEPLSGLDPLGQIQVLTILKNFNNQGKTVFFSSHNLAHLGKICGRVGLINRGKLKFCGNKDEFLKNTQSLSLEEAFLKMTTQDA
jgi:ABC-2 type transport system ATP-binding protein